MMNFFTMPFRYIRYLFSCIAWKLEQREPRTAVHASRDNTALTETIGAVVCGIMLGVLVGIGFVI